MGDSLSAGGEALRVNCLSDWTYAGPPLSFARGERRWQVRSVEAAWRAPNGRAYRVVCEDGSQVDLLYREDLDEWVINGAP